MNRATRIGGRLGRLALKELREILRDRRTIVTLVLMPLLVYPLLGLTFSKLVVSQITGQKSVEYHVSFETAADADVFRDTIAEGDRLLGHENRDDEPPADGKSQAPSFQMLFPPDGDPPADLHDVLRSQTADVGVRIVREMDQPVSFEFLVRQDSALGREAVRVAEERLRAINDRFVRRVFRQQTPPLRLPLVWSRQTIAGPGGGPAFSLATLVPLILTLMTVTGAVYPAIDLTAGERERGTLEALIAAPVPRMQILFAKYTAVMTVALLTAAANLLAMIATSYATGLEAMLFGKAGLSVVRVLQIGGLLAVFAAFFSAVMLTLTSFARSFKEAQAYLIPLMLVSLAPGILALLPGLKMTTGLALVPLANIVLLTRDLLDGSANSGLAIVTLVSTAAYAVLALALAARLFGTDAVLYGSAGTWQDLWQRPERRRDTPNCAEGLVAVAVLFPAFVLLGSVPSRLEGWALGSRLVVSAGVTLVLFVLWPLLLAWHRHVRLTSGFRLHSASVLAFLGAALLGLSLWPFAYEIEIATLSTDRIEVLMKLFKQLEEELRQLPLALKLVSLAVIPAICEEFFFRGWLFAGLKSRLNAAATIAISAGLFGLFHVLVRDMLLFERFLPTALMGVALGCVAWRTGSVLPGMLLHVLHNGLLLSLSVLQPGLERVFGDFDVEQRQHLPVTLLVASAITAVLGVFLLTKSRRAAESLTDSRDQSAGIRD